MEEVCRKMGISEATFYNWKKKYGGLGVSELRKLRQLAEELDDHRKARQALHPPLTITDMYNVLEKLRAGEPLSAKEQKTH
ncbi:hypothetical protein BH24BAC1_BH24BAC1_22870 [soil metagenome]